MLLLCKGAEYLVLCVVVREMVSDRKRMICFEVVPVRNAARLGLGFGLGLWLWFWLLSAVLIEFVL